jgi:hypothetical protein
VKPYGHEAHVFDAENAVYAAGLILSHLLQEIPAVRSAVDLGCGAGTWLSVLRQRGAEKILGVDGNWLDEDILRIPSSSFMALDLSQEIEVPGRYDLALSLEVAEHLPPERGPGFVALLTSLSDFVLFSAAIPYQQGQNHINCRWPEYWAGLFAANGFEVHDFLRARIWNDTRVPIWYKQNLLFFSKRQRSPELQLSGMADTGGMPLNVVHPDSYLPRVNGDLGFGEAMVLLLRVLALRLPGGAQKRLFPTRWAKRHPNSQGRVP